MCAGIRFPPGFCGHGYVLAHIDSNNDIAEVSEANNIVATKVFITCEEGMLIITMSISEKFVNVSHPVYNVVFVLNVSDLYHVLKIDMHHSVNHIFHGTSVDLMFDISVRSVFEDVIYPQNGEPALQAFVSLSSSHKWDGNMGDNYWIVEMPTSNVLIKCVLTFTYLLVCRFTFSSIVFFIYRFDDNVTEPHIFRRCSAFK